MLMNAYLMLIKHGNLEKTLKNLVKFIEKDKPDSIAIPKLASGVGGLEWDDVRQSIDKFLDGIEVLVYVYTTYSKAVKAKEE